MVFAGDQHAIYGRLHIVCQLGRRLLVIADRPWAPPRARDGRLSDGSGATSAAVKLVGL
jgi:hypothetical protein